MRVEGSGIRNTYGLKLFVLFRDNTAAVYRTYDQLKKSNTNLLVEEKVEIISNLSTNMKLIYRARLKLSAVKRKEFEIRSKIIHHLTAGKILPQHLEAEYKRWGSPSLPDARE